MAQISYRRFGIELLAGLCFFLGAAGAARADSTSNCFVSPNSSNLQTTNCSVVVDSNNYANASVIPGTANVGAKVGEVSLGGFATASAQNNDFFFCNAPNPCGLIPGGLISPMVRFTFQLDGTASATAGFMSLDASYTGLPLLGGSGGRFAFGFFEDPGKGPSTTVQASATFNPADGGTVQIPVTLTQEANGNYNFSLNYTTPATPLCFPGCNSFLAVVNGAPVTEIYGDGESVSAEVDGDGTPQFLNAISTFTVGITSLDPNFQPASLGGRTLNVQTPTTPEPASIVLLASGLAALFLLSRAHRL